jgi:uncharacterized coiled-coil DUF342 family protein
MSIADDFNIDNITRKIALVEFGETVFKIYEEQFEEIRKAYKGFEAALNNTAEDGQAEDEYNYWCSESAKTYHKFFKALFEAIRQQKQEQIEQQNKENEEFERMMERIKRSEPLSQEELNNLFLPFGG